MINLSYSICTYNKYYYGHRKPYEYDFCVCASAPTVAFVGVVCCNKCMSVHVHELSTWNRIYWTPLVVYTTNNNWYK